MCLFNVKIFRLNNLIQNELYPLRESLGLSRGQPKVLRYVLEHDSCSQSDVADAYDITPATVSKLIDGLIERDMIKKVEGKDRRTFALSLTAYGKEVYERWQAGLDGLKDRLTSGFSDEEVEIFSDLLDRAIDNMRKKS